MKQEQENFDRGSKENLAASSQLVRQDEEWVSTDFIRGAKGRGGGSGRVKGRRGQERGGHLLEFAHQKGE